MKNVVKLFLFCLVALSAHAAFACDDYYEDCSDPTPAPTLNVNINAPSPLSWNENTDLQLRSTISWSDGSRVAYPVYYTWVVNGVPTPNPNNGTFSITPVTMGYNGGYVRLSIIDSQGNQAQSQAVVLNVIPAAVQGPQAGDCNITGVRGNSIFDAQLTQNDCSNQCNAMLGDHPYASCMLNGGTELAPTNTCSVYGPQGGFINSFDNQLLKTCVSRANGARANHPNLQFYFGDDAI